jgi:SPP1 family phage portal protein
MELKTLQDLLAAGDVEKIREAVQKEKLLFLNNLGYEQHMTEVYSFQHLTQFRKEYYPHWHDINDKTKRPDKVIQDNDGNSSSVSVARLPVPMQQMIVSRAAAFLCGNPIERDATPQGADEENMLKVLNKIWEDNKLDYKSKHIAKIQMSETEVAELWFAEEVKDPNYWKGTPIPKAKFRMRMKILAHSYGDILYPVFDSSGDMIAFGRHYQAFSTDENKILEHFDIYTDQETIYTDNGPGKLTVGEIVTNPFGKIQVIYYRQPFPEWHYVQKMIDRYEEIQSNHADTNDYNGSPMIKVTGTVTGFSKKGERGKIIEITGDKGDASYMSWDQAVGSLELEYKNLRSLIFDMTDTPDISMEQMKSIGTFSGIALKMLFLNAHLKAADKEENFGESIQRRLNFLIYANAKINVPLDPGKSLKVKPMFEYYLPKDDKTQVDLLTESVTGGIMSTETAVKKNPLVEDPEAELKLIQTEKEAAANSMTGLNDLLNNN